MQDGYVGTCEPFGHCHINIPYTKGYSANGAATAIMLLVSLNDEPSVADKWSERDMDSKGNNWTRPFNF